MIDVEGEPARDGLPDTTGGAGQSDAAMHTMIGERLMAEIKQLRAEIDELAFTVEQLELETEISRKIQNYVIWLKERAK